MIAVKETRQKALCGVVKTQKVSTQEELLAAIQGLGIKTTQASLSRDISELGILKENGRYVLHPSSFFQGDVLKILSIQSAGSNMLVVKTATGAASTVAVGIDEAQIDGVVGTLAGDDTVFVALASVRKVSPIKKEIIKRFKPVSGH